MRIHTEYLDRPIVTGRVWDLIEPADGTDSESVAFFFIHGGGWRSGSRDRFHTIIENLTERGYVCASTDYRIAQSTRVAEQVADVRQSYGRFVQWLKGAGRPEKVVVFGSSAGGHLALLLGLAEPGACGDELPADPALAAASCIRPAGVAVQAAPVTFEPWDDIPPCSWGPIQRAVGTPYDERPDLYRAASPIRYVNDHSPPVFVLDAEYEHMFPAPVTQQLVDRMREAGRRVEYKVYPSTEHGFFYDITRRQQIEALEDLVAFAKSLDNA